MQITEKEKINMFYKALITRDQDFVGVFFAAVKTTSVFCISTCRARKPKLENVEFYTTFKAALDHGYRPCKICKPTENAYQVPKQVENAIKLVAENPKHKITDSRLRTYKISPELVRRWFKKNYGITFQAYQRMYRINLAFQELKAGKKTTAAAFDTGYESLSGFGYTYKKIIGKSPQKSIGGNIILVNRLTTPLGPMLIGATESGICLLKFVDRNTLEKEFKNLQRLLNANMIIGENIHIKQAKKQLIAYFEGKRKKFEIKLETSGTYFQNLAWNSLKTIEYGSTTTYQEQAEKIRHSKVVKAVVSAYEHNRILIVIPCHRVIGKNGELEKYGGGVERKYWLINHEQKYIDQQNISV